MKFSTCLLGLFIALVLLVDHFCYGDYFYASECTPNDVMNNCNSTDCIPGILVDEVGDEDRCAVFWEGEDKPISFRVCRQKTNGTASDLCVLSEAENPVQCKSMKFKICSNTTPSGGSGCTNLINDCKCKLPSDGTNDADAAKTCTDQ